MKKNIVKNTINVYKISFKNKINQNIKTNNIIYL